ncbi:hypothetical protein C5Y96_17855 [Blastopirellula marina]|uniref:Uncharacterized protein n=1 Tax=Blastopirellula marina TaxID=124 RepID=A0A2S8F643_9BACT|nr:MULTISPECIES: hypothetical protein [Pirellulaceae]PQO27404.1 hypothetical protein C5Y96_17855 [Blastopirellula marina]RCS47941.1 hypothetical protein DTL36_17880 [Bremerella cremea]
MSFFKRNHRETRLGMTIVELLVVLGVLAILLGIAATAVKTGTRGKKQREAARQVNAYIAAAQAKALQINRPVGIEITRNLIDADNDDLYVSGTDTGIANASLLMYTIETPPPYAGDTVSAGLFVESIGSGTITLVDDPNSSVPTPSLWQATSTSSSGLFTANQKVEVRLNYRGRKYLANIDNLADPFSMVKQPFRITVDLTSDVLTSTVHENRETYHVGQFIPYQIYVQPIRTSATPLQLPTDMCIDLTCSGIGNTGNEFANWAINLGLTPAASGSNNFSIKFLFSPRGNVERVNYNNVWLQPTGNIHMLVGKYEYAVNALDVMDTDGLNEITKFIPGTPIDYEDYVDPADPDWETNLADATAMWVSVNFQTGQITTTRNKMIQNSFLTSISALTQAQKNQAILAESRDFARSVLVVKGQGDN